MRLKDKLGNKSNASSEIEYHDAFAQMIGEEGRGVATIIDMVHHTRLDTMAGSLGIMRRALAEAVHHVSHRRAFQKTLIDQPLMRAVVADIALDYEAAAMLTMRVARAFDGESEQSGASRASRSRWASSGSPSGRRNSSTSAWNAWGAAAMSRKGRWRAISARSPLNAIWEGSRQCDRARHFAHVPEGAGRA